MILLFILTKIDIENFYYDIDTTILCSNEIITMICNEILCNDILLRNDYMCGEREYEEC